MPNPPAQLPSPWFQFAQDKVLAKDCAPEQWFPAQAKIEKDKADQAEKVRLEQDAQKQATLLAAQQKKAAADSIERKRVADIQAQKEILAKNQQKEQKKSSTDVSSYRFDFDKEFIPEGIKEESIKEQNRTVVRTIVNSKDVKATYLKVIYGYGGVFYFKNSESITESAYNQDINNFKKILKQ